MGRQCSAVSTTLGGHGGAPDRIGLLLARGLGRFFLLDLFQAQLDLIQGQGLGAAAEAVTLHLLDDLGEPIGPLPLCKDHRLECGRVVRKGVRERRHRPDYSTSEAS